MVLAIWLAWSAQALAASVDEVPAEPYATAVKLVERLFLEPGRTDENAMLRAAARGVARDLNWLQVKAEDHAVVLLHGNGTVIGRVEVHSMAELPASLARMEA